MRARTTRRPADGGPRPAADRAPRSGLPPTRDGERASTPDSDRADAFLESPRGRAQAARSALIQRSTRASGASSPGGRDRGGLPPSLRAGIESLSGVSMAGVRVHYGSDRPARIGALAFAQGREIHLAPGQDRHLPHEAWHLAQQAQGRVRPTGRLGDGTALNDDPALEREADRMGRRAVVQGVRAPDPDREAAEAPDGRPSPSGPIQRRVGFEFESADWRVYRHLPLRPRRRAARKEVVHSGPGFKVEGDDSGAEANLEFVTDPFAATPAGLASLNRSMRAIRAVALRLEQHRDRRGDGAGGFLGLLQHRFNRPFVELASRGTTTRVKMQATQGVALEDIPTMMRYFGIPAVETAVEAGERRPAREVMYAQAAPATVGEQKIARLIGSAPDRADDALGHLFANAAFTPGEVLTLQGAQDALRGFLAESILYVKALVGIATGGNELKYNLPFLARSNFAAIFGLLPLAVRQLLAAPPAHVDALADAVAHGASQGPIFDNPAGGFWDQGLGRNSPFVRKTRSRGDPDPVTGLPANFDAMGSLTIHAWMDGITQGVDRLTAGPMNAWLAAHEGALTARQRTLATERLESFASLGASTDPATHAAKTRLAIFENRGLSPVPGGNITLALAHQVAHNYLAFYVGLAGLAVGGNPGTYGNALPPPPP